MKKILVIGQALPAKTQKHPYDTTMFYDWLAEIGVLKEQVKDMFVFTAAYPLFPGYDEKGNHLIPTNKQMLDFLPVLEKKVSKADKIILLGNVAKNFVKSTIDLKDKEYIELLHPSKRNYSRFYSKKDYYLNLLKNFVYDESISNDDNVIVN